MVGTLTAGGTVADLGPADHVLLYTSSRSLSVVTAGLRCNVSLVLLEPPAIQGRYYRWLRFAGGRFHRVFTFCRHLLERLPGARDLAPGGTSLARLPTEPPIKSELVSLIASRKCSTAGHRLRHRIVSRARGKIAVWGRGYREVDDLTTALEPYRYSVVIENSRYPGYFSEKLIDCLLCRTVPIYWGDPAAERHFDLRGMICCEDEQDILDAVASCTPDHYDAMSAFIEANHRAAMHLARSPLHRCGEALVGESASINRAA